MCGRGEGGGGAAAPETSTARVLGEGGAEWTQCVCGGDGAENRFRASCGLKLVEKAPKKCVELVQSYLLRRLGGCFYTYSSIKSTRLQRGDQHTASLLFAVSLPVSCPPEASDQVENVSESYLWRRQVRGGANGRKATPPPGVISF